MPFPASLTKSTVIPSENFRGDPEERYGMSTEYICPICGTKIPRELDLVIPHTEGHIVDALKKKNPQWVEKNGLCRKCYTYYRNEIERQKKD